MFSGRRITITREGWYYLFVILFVSAGAVGGEVNLMMLLAGILIGPLLLQWRIIGTSLRRLEMERRLPEHVCAGDPLRVQLVLHNNRRRLGSWCVLARDQIRRLSQRKKAAKATEVQVFFPFTAAGEKSVTSYQWQLNQRGQYQFSALRLQTRFPFGLLKGSRKISADQLLLVCPRTGELTSRWFQAMEADRVGGQEAYQTRGNAEGDYYGLRHWQPGDSRRWIHWRTSARLGKLAVRQFEQQRDRDIALLLDLHLSAEAGLPEQAALELAVSMAATVIQELGRHSGIRLIFACSGTSMHYWATSSSHLLAREINQALATVEGGPGRHFQECILNIKEDLRPGSQVVIISTRRESFQEPIQFPVKPLWIDCSSQDLEEYFQLSPPASLANRINPGRVPQEPLNPPSNDLVTSHQIEERSTQ
ncbi:MAG TPA: DUF58 domain-containing protein [Planctomycetes bacterium]|nr:DUF58 domain-containing protein [Planctomycetaceae bacterium]HIN95485.1 DUF58 domain-containing protein [Planctomycetota bacterium]